MTPTRLQKNITYIDVLARAKPKQRKAILQTADKELITCLCECILNVLNGNVPLNPQEFDKLNRHRSQLRKLTAPETPLKIKQQLLAQKGGFLPILLAPILGIAGQLLADAIIKR